jgi:hypothetical protein
VKEDAAATEFDEEREAASGVFPTGAREGRGDVVPGSSEKRGIRFRLPMHRHPNFFQIVDAYIPRNFSVNHAVAIRTQRNHVRFGIDEDFGVRFAEWMQMVDFYKALSQLAIGFLEIESADGALDAVVLYSLPPVLCVSDSLQHIRFLSVCLRNAPNTPPESKPPVFLFQRKKKTESWNKAPSSFVNFIKTSSSPSGSPSFNLAHCTGNSLSISEEISFDQKIRTLSKGPIFTFNKGISE